MQVTVLQDPESELKQDIKYEFTRIIRKIPNMNEVALRRLTETLERLV